MAKQNLTKNIHSALVKKAEAEVEMAKANLAVYSSDNLIGIGEHQILAGKRFLMSIRNWTMLCLCLRL